MHIALKSHLNQAVVNFIAFYLQKSARFFAENRLRQKCIPLSCKIPEGKFDTALDPMFVVPGDSHFFSNLIGFFKADAEDILCQPVGVFFNSRDRIGSINAVQLHRIVCIDSELLQI